MLLKLQVLGHANAYYYRTRIRPTGAPSHHIASLSSHCREIDNFELRQPAGQLEHWRRTPFCFALLSLPPLASSSIGPRAASSNIYPPAEFEHSTRRHVVQEPTNMRICGAELLPVAFVTMLADAPQRVSLRVQKQEAGVSLP